MKKNSLNKDTFQNFREWLLSKDKQTISNVDGIISRIRSLEDELAETYVNGEKVGLLHPLYGQLGSAITTFSGKAKIAELNSVRSSIRRSFLALDEKKGIFAKIKSGNISKYKSVLRAYVYFLECMFPEFKEDGAIKDATTNKNIISGFQRLSVETFKKGIVGLLRKSKVILSSDSEMITLPMETFHQILDDYAKLHGANVRDDIYRTTSFITFNNNSGVVTDWEVVLADSMDIAVDGNYLNWSDIAGVCYNPLKNMLEIYYEEGWVNSIELPSFAVESSIDNELSAYVMAQPPLREQINILNELRGVCYGMKELMQPYLKFKKVKDNGCEYEEKLSTVINSMNHNRLAQLAESAYELLTQYGKDFHIELAIR